MSELWSLKRAYLWLMRELVASFVEEVSSVEDFPAIAVIDATLSLIAAGLEDNKSFQVRVAALELLGALIQVEALQPLVLESDRAAQVEIFFVKVKGDSKPEVILEAGKSLKLWKRCILHSNTASSSSL